MVNSDYYPTKRTTQRACLITCIFCILLFSPPLSKRNINNKANEENYADIGSVTIPF